jgi:hypothetical protein
MIYLFNFNIIYIITFATSFDSYKSSSEIHFKNYCIYCFIVFMSQRFFSNYCNRDPFLHYKTRANVYMVLGRGVVGSCFWCPPLFVFGEWGVSRVGAINLLKISGTTAQNLLARATGHPGFVHTWLKNGSYPRTVILPYDSRSKQQTIYLNSGTWLIFVMQPSFLQGWNWMFKYNLDELGVKLNLQTTCCVHFCATELSMTAEGVIFHWRRTLR